MVESHGTPERKEIERLRRLYPKLSDEELQRASENLDEYLRVVREIAERIESDPELRRRYEKLLKSRKRRRLA